MFLTFFLFEVRSWLRSPMVWIFMFLFALLTFFATISDNVSIGGSFGNIYKNAPFVAQNWYAVFSILSLLLLTAFLNSAAIRDFERKTAQIVFSSPIQKAGYYFGHFTGAILISLIPMFGVSLGMWVGVSVNYSTEWLDPERFGPFELTSHLNAFMIFVIPNAIFAGGILYTIAILTRSNIYAFIAAMLLLVSYIVAGVMMQDIENESLGALLDPFGIRAFGLITKYWTVDDKNTLSIGLFHSGMLWNRLLWMGVGFLVLAFGYFRFSFSDRVKRRKKRVKQEVDSTLTVGTSTKALPKVQPQLTFAATISQFLSQLKADFMGTIKSVAFILLGFLGLLNTVPNFFFATEGFGTHSLPVTYSMIDSIRGAFYLFLVAIMAYFTGALVWKERRAKVQEIYDALPTQNWTSFLAKLTTIVALMALLMTMVIIAAIISQYAQGYSRVEIGLYIRELLILDLIAFTFITVLFILIHALSPNMYLGFFLCIVIIIANGFAWDALKIATNMLPFGSTPGYTVSDLYGYQPYQKSIFWFNSYWALFSAILGVAAICFWPRGQEKGIRNRFRLAGLEWSRYKWVGFLAIGLWVLTGAWVYYNTFTMNTFRNSKQVEKGQVRYEKDYKKFQGRIQPRIYEVKYNIDLFPEQRALQVKGSYWVHNPHAQVIDTLLVQIPQNMDFEFNSDRLQLQLADEEVYFHIYTFDPVLAPNDSIQIDFSTSYAAKGFENELIAQEIVQNGSFFNKNDISPLFGYQAVGELNDRNLRRKYGLPEKTRAPELNPQDTFLRRNSYISTDADWVNCETIISTSEDQIAIAPGSLRKEWKENNRNYYQYKLDHPSMNFYSFMSARYEVAREKWNGVDLEVYYHKDHEVNVPRMLKSMRKSLEYYTENFGPYYHKQCRIIEFPRYASFAQAFPGTMPYSESIGFIEDYREEEDDIDMVFYIVAHEMGHQWWAHQECGAYMQGGEMTVETFAQYSALMVMEKEYGRDIMRKFLEYETDRYLRGRGTERLQEMPLAKCENQGYIHYRKGSAVMYYLKEMIGEEQVNQALRNFLNNFRYAPPPYPVTTDVVEEFAQYTPDSLKYIIDDLFWDITLFENRTEVATAKALADGKYEITIQLSSKKLKADGLGKENEVAINDWIDIGAFAKPEKKKKYGKTLYRKRVKIDQPSNTFTFVVDEKPDRAGIDPFSL